MIYGKTNNEILLDHKGLLVFLCNRQYSAGKLRNAGTLDDVIQQCCVVILEGLNKFDEHREGANLIQYIRVMVLNELTRLKKTEGVIRCPGSSLTTKSKETKPHLYEKASNAKRISPIPRVRTPDRCSTATEHVYDTHLKVEPDSTFDDGDEYKKLLVEVHRLPQSLRWILIRRFGLNGAKELSVEEISTAMGVSKTYVFKRIQQGLTYLREALSESHENHKHTEEVCEDTQGTPGTRLSVVSC